MNTPSFFRFPLLYSLTSLFRRALFGRVHPKQKISLTIWTGSPDSSPAREGDQRRPSGLHPRSSPGKLPPSSLRILSSDLAGNGKKREASALSPIGGINSSGWIRWRLEIDSDTLQAEA
jgi:hypothetical protein